MNTLPKEGKTPDQRVQVRPKAKAVIPKEKVSVLTIGQFAKIRKLKDAVGGFAADCKGRRQVGKFALTVWDDLWTAYCNRPIRG